MDESSAYGLEDAKSWITKVTDEDGKEATLCLGNTTGESDYYAMLKGGDCPSTPSPGDLVTGISATSVHGLAKLAEFPALSSSNTPAGDHPGQVEKHSGFGGVEAGERHGTVRADSPSEASSADSSAEGTDTKEYNWYLSGDVDVTKGGFHLTALRTEIDSIAFSRPLRFPAQRQGVKDAAASARPPPPP